MRGSRFVVVMALALALGGCVGAADAGDELPTDEAADEIQSRAWERLLGAWEGESGRLVGLVFTATTEGSGRHYFADRQVECITTPCNPVREEGVYRATSRYVYFTQGGTTERYSWTLRGDVLTLRQGSRVAYVLRRAPSYCAIADDCHEQRLAHPRCLGYWTCSIARRCAYRCGPEPRPSGAACTSNAGCASTQFCAQASCGGAGTCTTRPEVCTAIYDPVCGCDGRTYSSACRAANAGANVAYRGECR